MGNVPAGELAGRVALVTGAVRRIGRATALALAGDGAAVVINTRASRAEADAVAAEIGAQGGQGLVQLADVTDEAAVQAMVDAALARFGRLDILINNAADRKQTPLTEISLAEWRHITGIIVDGAFLCARACLPPMIAGGGGTIVNIGGVSAHIGAHNRAHVITAKAALIGLTKAIAVEFAARGITANCVVPGKIGGVRSRTAGEAPAMGGSAAPLVGREGTPEDVAAVVRQLCLPTSRYITGQTLHVSGGMYLP
jgi:3-oxoacyl-[acyl-carrier protein] reductase